MRSFASFLDILLSSPETPSDDQEHHGDNLDRIKRRRVLADRQGTSTRQLNADQSLEAILELNEDTCGHPGYIRGMCVACGRKVDHDTCLAKYHPLKYIFQDLMLAEEEIALLRNKESLQDKKLHLVLDLDHTLLNSPLLNDVTPGEGYLLRDISNGSLFRLDSIKMLTKLRPYVRIFLEEAGKLFDMYIYTMGERSYALEMARLLGPEEKYFGSKVIAREDCTWSYQKGLDVILRKESGVLILDDTEEVWAKHKENLIVMERYNFFASSRGQSGLDRKSLSELESDENETNGAVLPLASTLDVLKQIHTMYFFDSELAGANLTDRDVREVLKKYSKSCSTLTRPGKNRLSRGY